MNPAQLAELAQLAGLGVIVGAYGTIVGAGGGFIVVPLLLIVYGTTPQRAVGTSLAVVFMNALSGTIAYMRAKRVDYRSGWKLALATLPGAALGAFFSRFFTGPIFGAVFGGLLIALAIFLVIRPEPDDKRLAARRESIAKKGRGWVEHTLVDARGETFHYRFHERGAILASVGIGFLSSIFGIGGGIIHVPLLVQVFLFPAHIATATSHFILAITAAVGMATHLALGHVLPHFALPLGLGAFVGAQVGGYLSHRIRSRWLLRLLSIALVFVGIRLMAGRFA
jgi:uncharacterized protein